MPLLGRQTDFDGTLANMPKAGMRIGDIYRGTDPALHSFRWNGTYWQTLSTGSGVPLFDGLTHLSTPTYKWTATGAGTNEYACELAAGGNPSLTEPGSVYLNNSEATEGTPGSLAAGTWGWGTYSGFNTVHVRLSDGSDPDSQMYGYVKADPLAWVGGAGTATAQIQSGVPLMSVNSGAGTNTLRTRMRAVTGTGWVYYVTPKIVPSFSGTSGCGLAVSDGTKFRSICVVTDTATSSLRLKASNWDTNTTGFTDLGISIPVEYIMSHGDLVLAATDNGTNVQFFAAAHNSFARVAYQVSRATHVTPTMVGPCVYTNDDIGRGWFPQQRLT